MIHSSENPDDRANSRPISARQPREKRKQSKTYPSKSSLQAAFEMVHDSILFLDYDDFRILDANKVACDRLGYRRADLLNRDWRSIAPQTQQLLEEQDSRDQNAEPYRFVEIHRHQDGHEFPVETFLQSFQNGDDQLWICVSRDLRDRQQLEQLLSQDQFRDALTGVWDRRSWECRIQQAWENYRRSKVPFALLFADIDHFKLINDEYGHLTGDVVLREVARRLMQSVRPDDTVARYGGDEFVILVQRYHAPEDVSRIAERIQESMREPVCNHDKNITVSVSVGVAFSDPASISAQKVVQLADNAMFQAKSRGRNGHWCFANGKK